MQKYLSEYGSGYRYPAAPEPEDRCCAFLNDRLVVKNRADAPEHEISQRRVSGADLIPRAGEIREALGNCSDGVDQSLFQYVGELNGELFYAVSFPANRDVPEGYTARGIRELYGVLGRKAAFLAGQGYQLLDWDESTRFCSRCGEQTVQSESERVKICPSCSLHQYPRVSPAMIVAVIRNDTLLLARSSRWRNGFYSVLAGFVEPGESLEECVHREVQEEVGIQITNLRYFGSQPWPFPHSLMVGFTADWAGGEITPDPEEIADAYWCGPDKLPLIPGPISLARQLIDWFVQTHSPIRPGSGHH
jgi:NAD+ diphosphatase